MMTRRPFPEISLEPPSVMQANFDVPQMQMPQLPQAQIPERQSNLAGQVNQLGQIFKLGRYGGAGAIKSPTMPVMGKAGY